MLCVVYAVTGLWFLMLRNKQQNCSDLEHVKCLSIVFVRFIEQYSYDYLTVCCCKIEIDVLELFFTRLLYEHVYSLKAALKKNKKRHKSSNIFISIPLYTMSYAISVVCMYVCYVYIKRSINRYSA